jgi:YggT family protein
VAVLAVVATIVYIALIVFIVLMWTRLVFDLAASLSPTFRPRGPWLVLAEAAFAVTDPPMGLVRRVAKPLRMGGVVLDLSWSIVLLVALVLSWIVVRLT